MKYEVFLEKIENSTLSPSEIRVSNYLIKNFSAVPFCKIQTICDEAKVGKATVGRFLNKMGFTGFTYFQKEVVSELKSHEIKPPVRIITEYKYESELLEEHFDQAITNIINMRSSISKEQFELALDYLSNNVGTLYIFGAASSKSLAYYFYTLVQYLRKNVVLLEGDKSLLPHKLVDINKDDLLLSISFYRYSKIVTQVSNYFHSKNAKTMIITNNQVNPFADHCDVQFIVPSKATGPFQSRSMAFILLELLIKGLSLRNDSKNNESRFAEMEKIFSELNVFKNQSKRNFNE